jgi:hypothetical protein
MIHSDDLADAGHAGDPLQIGTWTEPDLEHR